MGGENSKRRQRDFYEWGANGVGGVRAIILSMHSLVQFRGVKIRCARIFFLHSVYENGKEVK